MDFLFGCLIILGYVVLIFWLDKRHPVKDDLPLIKTSENKGEDND